jgi:hypothetical protein
MFHTEEEATTLTNTRNQERIQPKGETDEPVRARKISNTINSAN